eukprot:Phypoly_transcript_20618.p1 GENE.Phypoly_transcript_20618~~Phypoly_transcript_20618.p1  ORF type:complete len:190 (+),score=24.95 Phypoly_transcript_20618:69-638(+)
MQGARRLIGVSGLNASGKTSVCDFFKAKGYTVLSLSDAIRAELKKQGKEETRDNLVAMGNELRNKNGPGILAKKTVEMLKPDTDYVIDSVRHPAEVAELRKAPNRKFFLIAVTAPTETRYERLKARGRVGDVKSFEHFLEVEKQELANSDKNGQQVQKVIDEADKVIDNGSTLESFNEKISQLQDLLQK